MILGTWQPLIENNKKENRYPELSEYLGFSPVFCFCAENEITVTIGSALSDASCPERLIVFTAGEAKKLNKVAWERRQSEIETAGKSAITLEDCFKTEGVPDYAVEFIVKGIKEEDMLLEISMDHMLNGGITSDDKESHAMTNMAISGVQEYCRNIFRRATDAVKIKPEDLTCSVKKSIIEWTLMPLWYTIAVEGSVIPEVSITYEDIVRYKVLDLIAEFLDKKKPETKTKENLERICRVTRNNYRFFDYTGKAQYYRPYANDMCPCGSRMKYKHCCGKQC